SRSALFSSLSNLHHRGGRSRGVDSLAGSRADSGRRHDAGNGGRPRNGARCWYQRSWNLDGRVRARRAPGRGGGCGRRRIRRRLSGCRLRDSSLCVCSGHRGRHGKSQRRPDRKPAGRASRQLRQSSLPWTVVLHTFCPHGRDPGGAADGALRSRVMRSAVFSGPRVAVIVFLLLLISPPFLSSFLLTLLTQALIYAILAMSLDIILGYTGLASLGHAAYFGLGAYSVGILSTRYGAGFWVTLPTGVLLAVAVAAIFGLVALRSPGVYFLMITLALGMVVWGLAHRWVTMTQGDNGISAIPRPDLGLPLSLAHSIPFYYFALAGFLITFWILWVIVRSPFGQTLVGIRESESRMRTLGYHVWLHKYIGFIIAGGFGGFAGVLWAYYNGFVSPVDLQLATSVEVLLMVALGGRGTLLGPALGAGIIVFLKNLVSVYTHRWL